MKINGKRIILGAAEACNFSLTYLNSIYLFAFYIYIKCINFSVVFCIAFHFIQGDITMWTDWKLDLEKCQEIYSKDY